MLYVWFGLVCDKNPWPHCTVHLIVGFLRLDGKRVSMIVSSAHLFASTHIHTYIKEKKAPNQWKPTTDTRQIIATRQDSQTRLFQWRPQRGTCTENIIQTPGMQLHMIGNVNYQSLSCPVEFAVVHVALAIEQILEQASQVIVVGRLKKVQPAHVPQVGGEFFWMTFAKTLWK